MYNQYLNKVLDTILDKEYNTLTYELDKAVSETLTTESNSTQDLSKVTQWLDTLKA